MSLEWLLPDIESEVRKLTGKPEGVDFTQPEMFDRINDFYLNIFPADVNAQELKSWYEFTVALTGDNEESLPAEVFTIKKPMTLKDSDGNISKLRFFVNENEFFELYPEDSSDEEAERGTPAAALLYSRTVYLRPKADEVFTFKAASTIKPTALIATTAPPVLAWGPAIAQGVAVMLKNRDRDYEAAKELDVVYRGLLTLINRRDLIQMHKGKRAMPRF